jgi:hypothetical protein
MGWCVEVVESQLTRGEEVATEVRLWPDQAKRGDFGCQGAGRANLSLSEFESRNLTSNSVLFNPVY